MPAGLPLYWLTSSCWRIGQQHFVLNKFYEDPEYQKVIQESVKERAKQGPKPSLRSPKTAPKADKPKPSSGRVTQPGQRSQTNKKKKR